MDNVPHHNDTLAFTDALNPLGRHAGEGVAADDHASGFVPHHAGAFIIIPKSPPLALHTPGAIADMTVAEIVSRDQGTVVHRQAQSLMLGCPNS